MLLPGVHSALGVPGPFSALLCLDLILQARCPRPRTPGNLLLGGLSYSPSMEHAVDHLSAQRDFSVTQGDSGVVLP